MRSEDIFAILFLAGVGVFGYLVFTGNLKIPGITGNGKKTKEEENIIDKIVESKDSPDSDGLSIVQEKIKKAFKSGGEMLEDITSKTYKELTDAPESQLEWFPKYGPFLPDINIKKPDYRGLTSGTRTTD